MLSILPRKLGLAELNAKYSKYFGFCRQDENTGRVKVLWSIKNGNLRIVAKALVNRRPEVMSFVCRF